MKDHIIVFGWDTFSKAIVTQLDKAKKETVIITTEANILDIKNEFQDSKYLTAHAMDYKDFDKVAKVDIKDSRVVLINLGSDTDNLVYGIHLRKHYANTHIVVPINNPDLNETFQNAGITYSLSKDEISAIVFSSYLYEKDVANYVEDLLDTADEDDSEDFDIQQYRVTRQNPFFNLSYEETFTQLRTDYSAVLIGISKIINNQRMLFKNPYEDMKIEEGDYLIMILSGTSAGDITKKFGVEEGL